MATHQAIVTTPILRCEMCNGIVTIYYIVRGIDEGVRRTYLHPTLKPECRLRPRHSTMTLLHFGEDVRWPRRNNSLFQPSMPVVATPQYHDIVSAHLLATSSGAAMQLGDASS